MRRHNSSVSTGPGAVCTSSLQRPGYGLDRDAVSALSGIAPGVDTRAQGVMASSSSLAGVDTPEDAARR